MPRPCLGLGREYAYGLLFRTAFGFSEKLKRFNRHAIEILHKDRSYEGERRRLSPEPNHDQDDEVEEPNKRGKKAPALRQRAKEVPYKVPTFCP